MSGTRSLQFMSQGEDDIAEKQKAACHADAEEFIVSCRAQSD